MLLRCLDTEQEIEASLALHEIKVKNMTKQVINMQIERENKQTKVSCKIIAFAPTQTGHPESETVNLSLKIKLIR